MTVPAPYPLALGAVLFTLGMVGVLVRRSVLVVFMSIELMLNAVNLTLVTFARLHGSVDGQVVVFFILVVAAVEVVIGLAMIVDIFRSRETVDIDDVHLLHG
ncbi:MAG TPA: NADH-quinone oxidoreductase subunit NuoK [bacterium]|nr:NADH-quinone oxidoreductase subunit NuoK [bacterium]